MKPETEAKSLARARKKAILRTPSGRIPLPSNQTPLLASIGYAIDGVFRTLNTQRNMKIHWLAGLTVSLVGMALELDISARASVIFCVFVVICMELLNTALEAFVDLHVKQYARTAMIAKDGAAAAVLMLALGAVVVFADIMVHRWAAIWASPTSITRTATFGLPLLGLTAALLFLRRNLLLFSALGAIAIGLVGYLAYYSRDEVFSLGALAFVLTSLYARVREPVLLADGKFGSIPPPPMNDPDPN